MNLFKFLQRKSNADMDFYWVLFPIKINYLLANFGKSCITNRLLNVKYLRFFTFKQMAKLNVLTKLSNNILNISQAKNKIYGYYYYPLLNTRIITFLRK